MSVLALAKKTAGRFGAHSRQRLQKFSKVSTRFDFNSMLGSTLTFLRIFEERTEGYWPRLLLLRKCMGGCLGTVLKEIESERERKREREREETETETDTKTKRERKRERERKKEREMEK